MKTLLLIAWLSSVAVSATYSYFAGYENGLEQDARTRRSKAAVIAEFTAEEAALVAASFLERFPMQVPNSPEAEMYQAIILQCEPHRMEKGASAIDDPKRTAGVFVDRMRYEISR